MAYLKDNAISLRRLDYSETSQVLVFYTAVHGQQRLIAKGVKRSTKTRFATGIDLLERGEVVFTRSARGGDALGLLAEWRQDSVHAPLRDRLDRLYAAQYVAELTAALTIDDDPHPGLFDALAAALQALCETDEPLAAVVKFQAALLTEVGLSPRLEACVSCGTVCPTNTDLYFSSHEGGLLCPDCEPHRVEKRLVARGAVEPLAEGTPVPREHRTAAFDLLDYHVSHLMGRPPKLSRFVVPPNVRRTLA